jgi:hypothetical protein
MMPRTTIAISSATAVTRPTPNGRAGARVALNFMLNIEGGSEYAMEHGDGFSEGTLTEMGESPLPRGARDLAAEGMFEYGSRIGVRRILDLFARATCR